MARRTPEATGTRAVLQLWPVRAQSSLTSESRPQLSLSPSIPAHHILGFLNFVLCSEFLMLVATNPNPFFRVRSSKEGRSHRNTNIPLTMPLIRIFQSHPPFPKARSGGFGEHQGERGWPHGLSQHLLHRGDLGRRGPTPGPPPGKVHGLAGLEAPGRTPLPERAPAGGWPSRP